MPERQHSSWKKGAKKKAGPTSALAQQQQSQRRIADGIHRPEPSTAPPARHDAWVDHRLAAQQEREEAADRARQQRLAGAPAQTEDDDRD